jgi:large subunit ribosomal protein L25
LTGGQPIGLKEGGVLHQALRELHVECLPSVLPDFIGIDASQLQINEGIHLKDIPKTEGLRFLDDPDHMVVSVAAPMTDAKLESLLATGAAAAEGAAGGEAGKAADAKAGAAAPKAGAAPAKKEPEKKK